ncbi:MAG: ECF-type sigma factor [Bryobacteraceae bacterium]
MTDHCVLIESTENGCSERALRCNGPSFFLTHYEELIRMARWRLRRERRDHTLNAAGLVHEAWLRLATRHEAYESVNQFLGVASEAMRRVLVDDARSRNTMRRSGGKGILSLEEVRNVAAAVMVDQEGTLRESLRCLKMQHPRVARLVHLRFYIGLTEDEASHVLQVTRRTLNRDWKFAKDWLAARLSATVTTAQSWQQDLTD